MNVKDLSGICAASILAMAMAQTPNAVQRVPTLPFVDQAAQHADFFAFRTKLLGGIDRRDVDVLLDAVDPGIRNNFGGDDGIEAFKRLWRLNAGDSEIWPVLGSVLMLGGTFEGADVFVAPYVHATWPGEFDPFEYVTVVGDGVRFRAQPRTDSRVLALVGRAVLRRGDGSAPTGWLSLQLPDGRSGFVSASLVRGPIDYRAYFVRSHGRWLMTALIAGD
jgi:hypothetical protein